MEGYVRIPNTIFTPCRWMAGNSLYGPKARHKIYHFVSVYVAIAAHKYDNRPIHVRMQDIAREAGVSVPVALDITDVMDANGLIKKKHGIWHGRMSTNGYSMDLPDDNYCKVPRAVLESGLKAGSIATLVLLSILAGNSRGAFPSYRKMCYASGIQPRTLMRYVNQLEKSGWLSRIPRCYVNVRTGNLTRAHRSNFYIVAKSLAASVKEAVHPTVKMPEVDRQDTDMLPDNSFLHPEKHSARSIFNKDRRKQHRPVNLWNRISSFFYPRVVTNIESLVKRTNYMIEKRKDRSRK